VWGAVGLGGAVAELAVYQSLLYSHCLILTRSPYFLYGIRRKQTDIVQKAVAK